MKRFAILLAPVFLASAAFAEVAMPDVADADGNGTWSLAELQVVWTDLTEDGFKAIDTNADGAVDKAELQAALDSGLVKVPA